MARSLDLIGDRWSLLLVRDAFDGMRRFGEFQRSLGVARNILAQRLQALVEDGILELVPASDGTAYHEYQLTPKGQALFPVVVGLRQWGQDHLYGPREHCAPMVDRKTGQPIRRLEVRAHNGRPLGHAEAYVKKLAPGVARGLARAGAARQRPDTPYPE